MTASNLHDPPPNLPAPVDDGAARHLVGMPLPAVALPSTAGRMVDLGRLGAGVTVLYCYSRTGRPDEALPPGWDAIPGARGCTPQGCSYRDHQAELNALGAAVFGIRTQSTPYQQEMVARLHLPFEVLSDACRLREEAGGSSSRMAGWKGGATRALRRPGDEEAGRDGVVSSGPEILESPARTGNACCLGFEHTNVADHRSRRSCPRLSDAMRRGRFS